MAEKQPHQRKNDEHKRAEVEDLVEWLMRTSILNAFILRIGSWMMKTEKEGELMAKAYFQKKALSWEILRNGYKKKLEIEWSNISGIKACLEEGKPGILEVEVSQKPKFYRNLHSDSLKHIEWVDGSDFTEGQAFVCRNHMIMFKPGVLNELFERLISTDMRLLELSQKPYSCNRLTFFHNEEADPTQTSHQTAVMPYNQSLRLPPAIVGNPIPATPGVGFTPHPNEMNSIQYSLTTDMMKKLWSMLISHRQLQPLPTFVTANPPLPIYREPRPLMSSSRGAPPMRLPIVRGFNNQMLRGHSSSVERAIPMAYSSSVLLAQNSVGLAAPNVSSQSYQSVDPIEHFHNRVVTMRALTARMRISNDVLMNHANPNPNEQVVNDILFDMLNEVRNANGGSNGDNARDERRNGETTDGGRWGRFR